VNYEVLCNALATNIIDLSQAPIYKLQTSGIPRNELEEYLMSQNQYSPQKFKQRYEKINKIYELE